MSNPSFKSPLMLPESPQPLHKPGQLNRFPYPNPHVSISSMRSAVHSSRLNLKESWN